MKQTCTGLKSCVRISCLIPKFSICVDAVTLGPWGNIQGPYLFKIYSNPNTPMLHCINYTCIDMFRLQGIFLRLTICTISDVYKVILHIYIRYGSMVSLRKTPCSRNMSLHVFIHSFIHSIQPLRPGCHEPEPSHVTGMALAHCILGKFLGVVCHCFPPPLDVPTFAARFLYVRNDARDPSSGRWNCGREIVR